MCYSAGKKHKRLARDRSYVDNHSAARYAFIAAASAAHCATVSHLILIRMLFAVHLKALE